MRTHLRTNDAKIAIGYVRVSTQEQATEGVSLDAQRDRLRTYCKIHSIRLIDINADDTHSAAGRMVPMNLANYNQFARETTSERTRDALQHMKAQGVRLGPAPYGYELSEQRDEKGRRILRARTALSRCVCFPPNSKSAWRRRTGSTPQPCIACNAGSNSVRTFFMLGRSIMREK